MNNYLEVKSYITKDIYNKIEVLKSINTLDIKSLDFDELLKICRDIHFSAKDLYTSICDLVHLELDQSQKDLSTFETVNELVDICIPVIKEASRHFNISLGKKFIEENCLFTEVTWYLKGLQEIAEVNLKEAYTSENLHNLYKILDIVYSNLRYSNVYNNQLEKYNDVLDYVYTISEAADIWGKDTGNLRREFLKPIGESKFHTWEVKKSGAVWLVTKSAMERVYGAKKNE